MRLQSVLIIVLLILFIIYLYKRDSYLETEEIKEKFSLIGDHNPDPYKSFNSENSQNSENSSLIVDRWKHLSINNKRPLTFNQNWNKVWKLPSKSNHASIVQDIPHSNDHIIPSKHILVNLFTAKQLKATLDSMVTSVSDPSSFRSMIVDPTKIAKYNSKTWVNRYNLYDPESSDNKYPMQKYPIPIINQILSKFLTQFNNNLKNNYHDMISKFGYYPFQIYKYKLVNIEESDTKTRRYSLIVVILRDVNVTRGYTLYLQYLHTPKSKEDPRLENYDMIGIYYADQLLMTKGFDPNNTPNQKDLLKVYNPIIPDNPNELLKKELKGLKQFDLTDQYSCFNINPKDLTNTIIMANDKHNCEDKYDFFGRSKPVGYWDKPCKSDDDCPFSNSNKNYPNSFGKCNNRGYCEMPIGVKPIGYHHYHKETKPLCYNCNSKSWKATTTLDDCCEKQKDKNIYPFLDGPDYAFKDDIFKRVNSYYKKLGCYTKHTYKNVFSNEVESSKVICPEDNKK